MRHHTKTDQCPVDQSVLKQDEYPEQRITKWTCVLQTGYCAQL